MRKIEKNDLIRNTVIFEILPLDISSRLLLLN